VQGEANPTEPGSVKRKARTYGFAAQTPRTGNRRETFCATSDMLPSEMKSEALLQQAVPSAIAVNMLFVLDKQIISRDPRSLSSSRG